MTLRDLLESHWSNWIVKIFWNSSLGKAGYHVISLNIKLCDFKLNTTNKTTVLYLLIQNPKKTLKTENFASRLLICIIYPTYSEYLLIFAAEMQCVLLQSASNRLLGILWNIQYIQILNSETLLTTRVSSKGS